MNGRVYVIVSDQTYYGRVYTRKNAEKTRRSLEQMGHEVLVRPCENKDRADKEQWLWEDYQNSKPAGARQ